MVEADVLLGYHDDVTDWCRRTIARPLAELRRGHGGPGPRGPRGAAFDGDGACRGQGERTPKGFAHP